MLLVALMSNACNGACAERNSWRYHEVASAWWMDRLHGLQIRTVRSSVNLKIDFQLWGGLRGQQCGCCIFASSNCHPPAMGSKSSSKGKAYPAWKANCLGKTIWRWLYTKLNKSRLPIRMLDSRHHSAKHRAANQTVLFSMKWASSATRADNK